MKTKHAIRAYTLVEILVVVGIIALLCAILLPVINRARENGRNTTCQSNLKQLGLSLQMYTSDNGGTLPLWWDASYDQKNPFQTLVPPPNGICWTRRLYPYFQNWDLVHCPDASLDRVSHDELDAGDNVEAKTGRPDYSFEVELCGINEALVYAPSETLTFVDTNAFSGNMFGYHGRGPFWGGEGGDRHFNGYNVAFYDGHVKWMNVNTSIGSGYIGKG